MTANQEAIQQINEQLFGPATDFADLPRDEKQKAVELQEAGVFGYGRSLKAERALGRNRKKKWANRISLIVFKARKRGKPNQGRPIGSRISRGDALRAIRAAKKKETLYGIDRTVDPSAGNWRAA